MTKTKRKSSVSSRPGKLIEVSAADILNKPLTKRQLRDIEKLRAMRDSAIDFSDIPELTEGKLAEMNRRREPKKLIAARLDVDVVAWLKTLGLRESGYSSHINTILRWVMEHRRKVAS
ncbi:MAG: BrnA antitoxin family protein [Acidobacteriaceae bacterium]|nr:BrnA antitoxin family protein [Acidobacteriaceae bacterium]MBV9781419.1 BrnA antitoxin family protein [Acidobacteriaceae bacterium]